MGEVHLRLYSEKETTAAAELADQGGFVLLLGRRCRIEYLLTPVSIEWAARAESRNGKVWKHYWMVTTPLFGWVAWMGSIFGKWRKKQYV